MSIYRAPPFTYQDVLLHLATEHRLEHRAYIDHMIDTYLYDRNTPPTSAEAGEGRCPPGAHKM